MGQVVGFPSQDEPDMIWRCDCGCTTFQAHDSGFLECAHCSLMHEGIGGKWRAFLPDVPSKVVEGEAGDFKVTQIGVSASALKRVTRQADPEDTAALILLQKDGKVSTWGGDFDTLEQAEWFERRIADARSMLKVLAP
jgi:hypothetical protein